MRAAVFKAPGQKLLIDTVADPKPGPDDLILQVKACGICGSDLHMSEVCDNSGGMKPLPAGAVMGHEFCGEIVELGANAKGKWKVGQRVTAVSRRRATSRRHRPSAPAGGLEGHFPAPSPARAASPRPPRDPAFPHRTDRYP